MDTVLDLHFQDFLLLFPNQAKFFYGSKVYSLSNNALLVPVLFISFPVFVVFRHLKVLGTVDIWRVLPLPLLLFLFSLVVLVRFTVIA